MNKFFLIFSLFFVSTSFCFEDPDFAAICKGQLKNKTPGRQRPANSCKKDDISHLNKIKDATDKVYDDAYIHDLHAEVSKEMRFQVASAQGISKCFQNEMTNSRSQPSPSFCQNAQKRWDDALGNSDPSCCHELIPDVKKSMARSAFQQRINHALANLNFPDYDMIMNAKSGLLAFGNQVEELKAKNRLSPDETLYMKNTISKMATTLRSLAATKGKKGYLELKEQLTNELKARTAFQTKNENLMELRPPHYEVSLQFGSNFFSKQAREKKDLTYNFLKGALDSPVRICAMRKFVDISVDVVRKGIKKTKDTQYCKAAERLSEKCQDYENDLLTRISGPLGEASFVLIGAGMLITSPWLTVPGVVFDVMSSGATIRDELLNSELEKLHAFRMYRGDKESDTKKFLNMTSSIPNFVPGKLMSLGMRNMIWGSQFIEGEVGGRMNDLTPNKDKLSSSKRFNEVTQKADSFKEQHHFTASEQIIYDHILLHQLKTTSNNMGKKIQNDLHMCIERNLETNTNLKSESLYKCMGD
jgi:hypothetical protein